MGHCCGNTGTVKTQHPSSLVDAPLLGHVQFILVELSLLKQDCRLNKNGQKHHFTHRFGFVLRGQQRSFSG